MTEQISVPIRVVNGKKWGHLAALGENHEICAEKYSIDDKFTFAGQHRVRLFKLKKNVHWRVPPGSELNITDVAPAAAPRRQPRR